METLILYYMGKYNIISIFFGTRTVCFIHFHFHFHLITHLLPDPKKMRRRRRRRKM